jgi:hypothetical protein
MELIGRGPIGLQKHHQRVPLAMINLMGAAHADLSGLTVPNVCQLIFGRNEIDQNPANLAGSILQGVIAAVVLVIVFPIFEKI